MHLITSSLSSPRTMYASANEMVVVKLKPPRAAARARTGDAEVPAFATLGAGPTPAGATKTNTSLDALLERGYVVSMKPLLARAGHAALGAPTPAAMATARPRRTDAFVTLKLDRGTSPEGLVRHLTAMGEEVEIAYIPPIRQPLAKKKAAKNTAAANGNPNDPLSVRQWGHAAVRIHDARAAKDFVEADGVAVAVVDSGIDEGHPDVQACIRSYHNLHDAREDKSDYFGHGTHVAGIIAATINNAIGVSGLCKVKIDVIKGLPQPGTTWTEDVYRSFLDSLAKPLELGAHVVNLSLGSARSDPAEQAIIEDLLDAHITVVAAMGNDYEKGNPTTYPAAYDGVIAVGATDEADRRASFSNTGPHIAITAPGERVLSTIPRYPTYFAPNKTDYDSWPGTSMATPHVAAAVALLLAKNPDLDPAEVRKALMESADPVPGQGSFSEEYGAGRLNIAKLLA